MDLLRTCKTICRMWNWTRSTTVVDTNIFYNIFKNWSILITILVILFDHRLPFPEYDKMDMPLYLKCCWNDRQHSFHREAFHSSAILIGDQPSLYQSLRLKTGWLKDILIITICNTIVSESQGWFFLLDDWIFATSCSDWLDGPAKFEELVQV